MKLQVGGITIKLDSGKKKVTPSITMEQFREEERKLKELKKTIKDYDELAEYMSK